jgi:hypothetical protein
MFDDNPALLRAAIDYLEYHRANPPPDIFKLARIRPVKGQQIPPLPPKPPRKRAGDLNPETVRQWLENRFTDP